MRSWRSTLALASLCLALGASPAEWMVRLGNFLTAVWESDAGIIDPWGAPTTDEAGEIDPLGRVSPAIAAPGTDEADQIDPFGRQ